MEVWTAQYTRVGGIWCSRIRPWKMKCAENGRNSVHVCVCVLVVWSGNEVRGNEARNSGSRQFVEDLICQAKESWMHAANKGSQIRMLTEHLQVLSFIKKKKKKKKKDLWLLLYRREKLVNIQILQYTRSMNIISIKNLLVNQFLLYKLSKNIHSELSTEFKFEDA